MDYIEKKVENTLQYRGYSASQIALVTDRILEFHKLFCKWNLKINLTSRGSDRDLFERHVLDCVYAALAFPDSGAFVDLGSGGGFPGVMVSIVNKASFVVLIEADKKSAAFLKEVCRLLKLGNVKIIDKRIEECCREELVAFTKRDKINFTSRAFSPFEGFFELIRPLYKDSFDKIFYIGTDKNRETISSLMKKSGFSLNSVIAYHPEHPRKKIYCIENKKERPTDN